jgi:hypothetical protein
MSATPATVAGRVEQATVELDPVHLAAILAVGAALGFTLLFLQDPLVHDSLHNFRHSIGVTCH